MGLSNLVNSTKGKIGGGLIGLASLVGCTPQGRALNEALWTHVAKQSISKKINPNAYEYNNSKPRQNNKSYGNLVSPENKPVIRLFLAISQDQNNPIISMKLTKDGKEIDTLVITEYGKKIVDWKNVNDYMIRIGGSTWDNNIEIYEEGARQLREKFGTGKYQGESYINGILHASTDFNL